MDLRKAVKDVLNNLAEETVTCIVDKLEECGVETIYDLSFIVETDFSDILRPIQIRKLLAAWKQDGNYCFYMLHVKSV